METQERDWIADWNLDDWQQLDAATRQAWIEDNLWHDPVDDELDREGARRRDDRRWRQESAAKESYRLGRTVWDIGLQPQPFTVGMAQAIDKVKPEHGDGIYLADDVRPTPNGSLQAVEQEDPGSSALSSDHHSNETAGLADSIPKLRARFLGARELLYNGKIVWPVPGVPDEASMELLVFLGSTSAIMRRVAESGGELEPDFEGVGQAPVA